jgi:cardiolipin synthase (CMP-forming)
MKLREFGLFPNLLSLSRILTAPVIAYFLWRMEFSAMWIALGLIILAAITDGLDGYVARRMNLVSPLGVALDPIADKIFAGILVISLIFFRNFPFWIAALVIGRDVLILLGGVLLLRNRHGLTLPSNLTGKWAFAALAVLMSAYVIRFEFSISVMTPIVTVLLLMSLVVYGKVFLRLRRGQPVRPFSDRAILKIARITLCGLVAVAHFWMFWVEYLR